MRHRRLGRSDLVLPVVTFGAWALGGGPYWGAPDDDVAVQAIRAALDAGIDAIDTAPVYGFGHSERVVGRAIAGRRDEVVLCTKVGLRWDCADGELFFESPQPNGEAVRVYRNSRPESVTHEVDASLVRLGVECIDLVQVHWPDPTTPVADTMGALCALHAAGKVRAVGVSNYDVAQLDEARSALGSVPLASTQPKYSLLARQIEQDVLPWCREHDVGVLAYSPIEQGLLSGKFRGGTRPRGEGRTRRPTFREDNRRRVHALLDEVVRPIADGHGATLAQVVIAWTVEQPGLTTAIVGARRKEQAVENAAAGDLVLSASEWGAIDGAFAGLQLADA